MCSASNAEVSGITRQDTALVPDNRERFAQRLAFVRDAGAPQCVTNRLHHGWNDCHAEPRFGEREEVVRHAALEQDIRPQPRETTGRIKCFTHHEGGFEQQQGMRYDAADIHGAAAPKLEVGRQTASRSTGGTG